MVERPRLGAARIAFALAALCAGCGSRGDDLLIGRDGHPPVAGSRVAAAGTGPAWFGNAGKGGKPGPVTPVDNGVSAEIRDREGVAIEVVTVSCTGECFEVEAVARGGYPPYTYRWEDGSVAAVRRLCPDATRTFKVEATDRGFSSEEFTRDPETAAAEVIAEVLSCPRDAGTPPPLPDAGDPTKPPPMPAHWEPLCIPNGSFEDASGAPWHYCPPHDPGAPLDILTPWSTLVYPPVINGQRYLRMEPTISQPVTISAPFCGPVTHGVGYYHEVAAMRHESDGIRLEFYFANNDCELEGLIFAWDTHMGWIDACWTWPALWEARYIVIRAVATGMRPGTLYLDSMVLNPARCPPPI